MLYYNVHHYFLATLCIYAPIASDKRKSSGPIIPAAVLEIFVFGLSLAFLWCSRPIICLVHGFEEAFTMSIFRALLISVAVLAITSSATFAQVRIITPDSEHFYSTDPRAPGQTSRR